MDKALNFCRDIEVASGKKELYKYAQIRRAFQPTRFRLVCMPWFQAADFKFHTLSISSTRDDDSTSSVFPFLSCPRAAHTEEEDRHRPRLQLGLRNVQRLYLDILIGSDRASKGPHGSPMSVSYYLLAKASAVTINFSSRLFSYDELRWSYHREP